MQWPWPSRNRLYEVQYEQSIGIEADILMRLAEVGEPVDSDLVRRVLANHVGRAGYLLALIHRRDGWRYDLDGKPAGEVDGPGPQRGSPFAGRAPEAAAVSVRPPPATPGAGAAAARQGRTDCRAGAAGC